MKIFETKVFECNSEYNEVLTTWSHWKLHWQCLHVMCDSVFKQCTGFWIRSIWKISRSPQGCAALKYMEPTAMPQNATRLYAARVPLTLNSCTIICLKQSFSYRISRITDSRMIHRHWALDCVVLFYASNIYWTKYSNSFYTYWFFNMKTYLSNCGNDC